MRCQILQGHGVEESDGISVQGGDSCLCLLHSGLGQQLRIQYISPDLHAGPVNRRLAPLHASPEEQSYSNQHSD